ncbi:MAG: TonB-dependent receptor [Candidatus Aminicenantes bacterium]|nr:TonB-dependent receptor [Candidatus Aminicenantes bacterium]
MYLTPERRCPRKLRLFWLTSSLFLLLGSVGLAFSFSQPKDQPVYFPQSKELLAQIRSEETCVNTGYSAGIPTDDSTCSLRASDAETQESSSGTTKNTADTQTSGTQSSSPTEKKQRKTTSGNSNKQEKNSTRPEEETTQSPQFRPHEEIIVTATMSPLEVKNSTVSTSVVTQEKLAATNVSNALNALLFEPGIFIMRTGDFGRSDVEIRGLGQRGQRIGVMVDGRPEKMGIFGCVVTQTFPFDNVDRLEVVRGPNSVFYGSDALGGVVNIITHTPGRGFENEILSSYGSFDTRRVNLRHGAGLEKFKYYLTYDHSQSDGHLSSSAYRGDSFTGKAIYQFSEKWALTLSGKYYDGLKHEPTILYPNPPAENWFDYKRGAADLTLTRHSELADLSFKFYTDFGRHRFSDGWNSRDHVYGSILKYTFSGWRNNQLTVGTDYRYLDGQSFNFPVGSWHRSEGGFFLYDQFTFKQKLILTGGARLNIDSVYGTAFAPSAGLVFFLTENTSLRALVSKGFRSPQLSELYLFPSSNPDLKPETLWNYEVGLNQRFLKRFDFGLTFFTMRGKNFIELRPNPTPPPMYRLTNIGTYRAKGLEATFSGQLTDGLKLMAAGTYLDPGTNTQGKAGQKYDLTLIFSRGKLFQAASAQYVTDYYAGNNKTQKLPSFFLLNYKIEWKFTRYLSAFLNLDNLLNAKYQIYVNLSEAAGPYPMPGRSVFIGLKITP